MAEIDKISLHNFKAFYTGISPEEINLGGKHLLMYGENGSGKSSIYWALYTLFQSETKTVTEISKYFLPTHDEQLLNFHYLNSRPDFEIDTEGKIINPTDIGKNSEIVVKLTDGTKLSIDKDGNSESVVNKLEHLHRHSDFITHRLLVNFYNFRNSKEINLWEVFVRDFFPFLIENKGRGSETLWQKLKFIEENFPFNLNHTTRTFKRSKSKIRQQDFRERINRFNEDIEHWITRINAISNIVYKDELKNTDNIEIYLKYNTPLRYDHYINNVYIKDGIAYSQGTGYAGINNPSISLNIRRRNTDGSFSIIHRPQAYLNEAKITQIALSIRFSLLHNTIKPPYAGQFLALDDLLISLDMSNREHVLDAILNIYAKKYKIYLFTHERSFFNMVKARVEAEYNPREWLFKEIYGVDEDNLKPQILQSDSFVSRSNDLYRRKDYPASVNYLRKELEHILENNLPKKIRKNKDGKDKTTLDNIITAGIDYLELLGENSLKLKRCKQYLQLLLNPLSHNENDIDAYEVDIKRIRIILGELRPFLEDIKKRTREILPRLEKIKLRITENDGITDQEYLLELQEELYCITQTDGSKKLTNCKVHSKESRTYKNGVLETKADYKNEHWKKDSLEILYNDICAYKTIIPENYIDFYENTDGVKLSKLIS
ncbi:ATP-binding protein [Elizabethkingia anophelis]|uniref:ATP-binding protein n=1 Tax=Elizabethkingia anophelis TaxID=1117645 RepID=UPI0021A816D5|nr:ATP-binding protein [Elizabethkingia anophelis]MCT3682262.1 ATP-binding protein [Elizabethkingia anophelis]MCT3771469.1 ATP-binding protein [Elizabethkingia anophelis]MCT3781723.1 ATP-binding protein [Elizabethkingia anophelis]